MKRFAGASLMAVGLVLLAAAVVFLIYVFTPYGAGGEFTIEPGMTVTEVLERLEEKRILSNKHLFKIYVRLRGMDRKIRAGQYKYPPRITPYRLLEHLLRGDFETIRLTIPEGWTTAQIADSLAGRGLVSKEEFMQAAAGLEGYLFPDTYEIYKPKGAGDVIKKMVDRFNEVYAAGGYSEIARERGMTDDDVLILASIVEKETGVPEERPLIASVFLNRLKKGIALASDPTVIYGINDFDGNLRRRDLESPGPYNTYLNLGLPPTPICNPGRDSIHAVLYPAETDYLYFVSKGDGNHHFSKTLSEHMRAVQQYQVAPFRRAD